MFTEITEDTISATDSCQMETTGTTLKVSPATQPTNQVTSETYTVIPPRRTFNEQKPFVFSIIGFAVFYIIALIVGRVIKMLDVKDDHLVVESKGIYSIENFLTARRLMYWQVYLHKTSVAYEKMLISTLLRAKEQIGRAHV